MLQEEQAAPTSDRLGELLRLYSELTPDKKARAFDYIAQLHSLDHGGSGTVVVSSGGRRLSSPPPPPLPKSPMPGRVGFRPEPVQLPLPSSYEPIEPPQPSFAPPQLQQQMSASSASGGPPAPVTLQVTLTNDQLARLTGAAPTISGDPLDGLVHSVFSPAHQPPSQPYAPNYGAAPPPPQAAYGGVTSFVPPSSSPLRRQCSAASAAYPPAPDPASANGGESIYTMLARPPAAPPAPYTAPVSSGYGSYSGGQGGGGVGVVSFAAPPSAIGSPYPNAPSHFGVGGSNHGPSSLSGWGQQPSQQGQMGFGQQGQMGGSGFGQQGQMGGSGFGQQGQMGGSGFGRRPPTPPPYAYTDDGPSAVRRYADDGPSTNEIRNLHNTLTLAPDAEADGGYAPPGSRGSSGDRRPFMQSLTSMHHSPTRTEASNAERRRHEWLRDLAEQVSEKESQRRMAQQEKELEEMKEDARGGVARVRSKGERHLIHATDGNWAMKGAASYS